MDRFWAKVDKTETCWLWNAATGGGGYGRFWAGGKLVGTHRYAYNLLIGEIPSGLDLDHLCRVRSCVRPSHLEPVTRKENMRRAPNSKSNRNSAKTECPLGHSYSPNLNANGARVCIVCQVEANKRYKQKKYLHNHK